MATTMGSWLSVIASFHLCFLDNLVKPLWIAIQCSMSLHDVLLLETELPLLSLLTISFVEKLVTQPESKTLYAENILTLMPTSGIRTNVNIVHLYSAICIASEALFVNHLHSTPSQGRLGQCRLCFEHDTLRLPPYAGT